jgi:hypothetical protein
MVSASTQNGKFTHLSIGYHHQHLWHCGYHCLARWVFVCGCDDLEVLVELYYFNIIWLGNYGLRQRAAAIRPFQRNFNWATNSHPSSGTHWFETILELICEIGLPAFIYTKIKKNITLQTDIGKIDFQ